MFPSKNKRIHGVRVCEGSDGKYVSLYKGITEDPKDSQYTLLLSYYLVIYYNILINDLTSTLISVTVMFLHTVLFHILHINSTRI